MRNLYLFSSHDQALMTRQLTQFLYQLAPLLKGLFRLHEEKPPTRHEHIITRSAERFGLKEADGKITRPPSSSADDSAANKSRRSTKATSTCSKTPAPL